MEYKFYFINGLIICHVACSENTAVYVYQDAINIFKDNEGFEVEDYKEITKQDFLEAFNRTQIHISNHIKDIIK